jgi:UbiD family decarboxylase
MAYHSLEACLLDLEQNGQLVRIKEEVDPYLEMATIHHRVYEVVGPTLLFENVKGSKFRAVSNLFGSLDRFIIRLGMEDHYSGMSIGLIDSRDVLYFVGVSAFFILLTRLRLQARNW